MPLVSAFPACCVQLSRACSCVWDCSTMSTRRTRGCLAWLCIWAFGKSYSCPGTPGLPPRLVTSPKEAKAILSDPQQLRHTQNLCLRENFELENVFTTNDTELRREFLEVVNRGMAKPICGSATTAARTYPRGQQPLSRVTEKVVFEAVTRAFIGAQDFDGIDVSFFDCFNDLWRNRRDESGAVRNKTSEMHHRVQAFYTANKDAIDSYGVWGKNLPTRMLRDAWASNPLSIIIPIYLNTWVAVQRILVRLLRVQNERQRVLAEIKKVDTDASLADLRVLDEIVHYELRSNPPVKSLERQHAQTGEHVKVSIEAMLNNGKQESWEFGGGIGACPAQKYACRMMKAVVAKVLPHLSISKEEFRRTQPNLPAVDVEDVLVQVG
ncbi:unnamed protein product [Symbiodinium sp. CCMP2592]|nr:unnamed protein product [Symbiodinium sp. CCMP2592]